MLRSRVLLNASKSLWSRLSHRLLPRATRYRTTKACLFCGSVVGTAVTGASYLIFPKPISHDESAERALLEQARRDLDDLVIREEDPKGLVSYTWYSIRSTARVLYLGSIFGSALLATPLLFFDRTRNVWYDYLVAVLEWAGPTFIKLGQWAATRPDIFPDHVCQRFSRLHSRVMFSSFEDCKQIIEAELGSPIEDIFSEFEETPLGSGCIAQVHGAKLKDGRAVVVKVRRKGVLETVQLDYAVLCTVAGLLSNIPILKPLNPLGTVRCFMDSMRGQLDLTHEALNLDQFNFDFRHDSSISFPKPVRPWVSRSVLVETRVEGISLTDVLLNRNGTLDELRKNVPSDLIKAIPELGIYAFFSMILKHNLVHGDLHPGNILVRFPKQTADYTGCDEASLPPIELVFMDAGLTVSLNETQRDNFIDLVRALASGQGYEVARLIIERSPQEVPPPPECQEAFKSEMGALISNSLIICDGPISSSLPTPVSTVLNLQKVDMAPLLLQVANISRRYHVQLDSSYINLLVASLVMEGIGKQLNSDMNLFAVAAPMLYNAHSDFKRTAWKGFWDETMTHVSSVYDYMTGSGDSVTGNATI